MNKVRVNKNQLLNILEKNRDEHRDVFLKAQEGYRTAVIEALDEQLTLARKKQPFSVRRALSMIQPVDHTDDYERAIGMLKMSVDDTIELDWQQYSNFVDDDWDWSRHWATSNSHYTSSPKFNKYREE